MPSLNKTFDDVFFWYYFVSFLFCLRGCVIMMRILISFHFEYYIQMIQTIQTWYLQDNASNGISEFVSTLVDNKSLKSDKTSKILQPPFIILSCQLFGYFACFTTLACDNFWTMEFWYLTPSPILVIQYDKHLFHCLFVCFCFCFLEKLA